MGNKKFEIDNRISGKGQKQSSKTQSDSCLFLLKWFTESCSPWVKLTPPSVADGQCFMDTTPGILTFLWRQLLPLPQGLSLLLYSHPLILSPTVRKLPLPSYSIIFLRAIRVILGRVLCNLHRAWGCLSYLIIDFFLALCKLLLSLAQRQNVVWFPQESPWWVNLKILARFGNCGRALSLLDGMVLSTRS